MALKRPKFRSEGDMEALTFNIHDIMILLGLITAIWAVYKIIKEISEPRKALEKQVDTLELWHKEDHHRIKEMEEQQKLILKSLYLLIEHEVTGNGITDFKSIKTDIERIIF